LRDEQGNKYIAEKGDVVVFTPNKKVFFDAESDGEAFYTAHRIPESSFM
jgi:quercetin dioxygenase-like cupin family protein